MTLYTAILKIRTEPGVRESAKFQSFFDCLCILIWWPMDGKNEGRSHVGSVFLSFVNTDVLTDSEHYH